MGSRAHNFLIHRINQRIAEELPYRGRVIDLGCGLAPYKQLILRSAKSYVGVDWPKSFHGNPNTDVYASLRDHLPFQPACADTVVSFQVMEHLPDPNTLLGEAHRILRPGGALFLTIPFMWLVHEAPYDYCRYTRHGLQHLLEKHGFVEIEIRENTGFWQMWSLKFNYHTQRPHSPLKYLLLPVWVLSQIVTPWMDRFDRHPEETASYTVLARTRCQGPARGGIAVRDSVVRDQRCEERAGDDPLAGQVDVPVRIPVEGIPGVTERRT